MGKYTQGVIYVVNGGAYNGELVRFEGMVGKNHQIKRVTLLNKMRQTTVDANLVPLKSDLFPPVLRTLLEGHYNCGSFYRKTVVYLDRWLQYYHRISNTIPLQ
jgi:hypothetical protein